jgi:hypothetical protein
MIDGQVTLPCWGGPKDGSDLTASSEHGLTIEVPVLIAGGLGIGFGRRTLGRYMMEEGRAGTFWFRWKESL